MKPELYSSIFTYTLYESAQVHGLFNSDPWPEPTCKAMFDPVGQSMLVNVILGDTKKSLKSLRSFLIVFQYYLNTFGRQPGLLGRLKEMAEFKIGLGQ